MKISRRDYEVVVVGAGPNGLSAAIALQQKGLNTLLIEGASTIGGGMRSGALTLPGFTHDICSAIHPMAAGSPFFSSLPLKDFGLEFIYPIYAAAHPLSDGTATILESSIAGTASLLSDDCLAYTKLFSRLVSEWPLIASDVLGPLKVPRDPFPMFRFGSRALLSSNRFVHKYFKGEKARSLFAGMAAHGMLPFSKAPSAAAGMTLMILGHTTGWPMVKGGSQQLANALASYFTSLGGEIQTSFHVRSLKQLPGSQAVVLDVSPRQLLEIAGYKFSESYKKQLRQYRYGMGVFKIDWALDAPIPFTSESCRKAGTIHLGNSYAEIEMSERLTAEGRHPEKPFVILAQQSIFDQTRAPAEKHTAWGYCHVPRGSVLDMQGAIEKQVERFAPGFRDTILSRHTTNTEKMEEYNPNNVGGNINGGEQDLRQLFTRPALKFSPYRTSSKGIYICSASTPPGGGVHGMCGYQAAQSVLRDIFKI